MSIILSADIGGTKTRLELNQLTSGQLVRIKRTEYQNIHWPNFEALLDQFLDNTPQTHSACFAVAGPIKKTPSDTQVSITNLPWQLSQKMLIEKYQFKQVSIINDFEAVANSVEQLKKNEWETLQAGHPIKNGTRAFIGAGTGLGQAIATHNGIEYNILATEGGHTDFAPNNDFEVVLYQFLNQKYQHVSYERLLSGEGLYNIYQFLKQIHPNDASSELNDKKIMESSDKAKTISQQALLNPNGIENKSIELLFSIYGAQAGNLALTCLPTGGLYIAGGLALKNKESLKASTFIQRFNAKGRMQSLMQTISIKLITTPYAGLNGATQVAMKQTQNLH